MHEVVIWSGIFICLAKSIGKTHSQRQNADKKLHSQLNWSANRTESANRSAKYRSKLHSQLNADQNCTVSWIDLQNANQNCRVNKSIYTRNESTTMLKKVWQGHKRSLNTNLNSIQSSVTALKYRCVFTVHIHYASRRSRTRDTVKLTVFVCVFLFQL